MIPSNPTMIPRPFADEGVAATIPDDKQNFGEASWREGFPTETGLPLNAGGIPPRKADFNGTLKTLSQHTFFLQSGCVYPWDATINYLANSHVVGSDGKEYAAKQASGPDDAAGAQDPTLDTEATYWADVSKVIGTGGGEPGPTPGGGGIYNTREILTTSGTYTAKVTGWHKVTCIGGGGGGGGAYINGSNSCSGGGGASGTIAIRYAYLNKDETVSLVIGSGGTGGTSINTTPTNYHVLDGAAGGTTSVTIRGTVISAAGGRPGQYTSLAGQATCSGLDVGFSGNSGDAWNTTATNYASMGGSGGGFGGGISLAPQHVEQTGYSINAVGFGGGGAGGISSRADKVSNGGNGYQGCVAFEYFDQAKSHSTIDNQ